MTLRPFFVTLLFVASVAVHAQDPDVIRISAQKVSQPTVDGIIAGWKEKPREVARTMIAKYGLPDGATPDMLVWKNNGPWAKTVLENVMIPHNFPSPHHDMLYQCINYRLPESAFDDLARFDGSVIAERTRGTLGARCDDEEANFLAVNLAYDVATGKKTVGQARSFYADAVTANQMGNTTTVQSRYLREFVFDPNDAEFGDPDAEWDGTYVEEYDYYAYQETDEREEKMMREYEMKNKDVVRMTGLPGRPDYDLLMYKRYQKKKMKANGNGY
jgi:hypothetical protein